LRLQKVELPEETHVIENPRQQEVRIVNPEKFLPYRRRKTRALRKLVYQNPLKGV
jgi:hypothetical protein